MAKWITSYFPFHRRYVEPFCGAASILFAKERSYAELINDKSKEIYNLFCVLRDENLSQKLIDLLRLTPFAKDEYLACFEYTADKVEQARRLIVRSFMGMFADSVNPSNYVSGFRSDLRRKGGIPSHLFAKYPEYLSFFIERLKGVVIQNIDAFDCIKKYDDQETLFYLDPPYIQELRTQSKIHQYFYEMSLDQHKELIDLCLHLKGNVAISFYDHEVYETLAKNGWQIFKKEYYGKQECLAIKQPK